MSEIFNCEVANINNLFFNIMPEEEEKSEESKLESPAHQKIKADEEGEDE